MRSSRANRLWLLACWLFGCAADATAPEGMADGRLLQATDGSSAATFLVENPTKGRNALRVELFGRGEEPLSGVTVQVSPWMPAHGHSSKDTVAVETESGVYEADDLLFSMAGLWELHVEITGEETAEHFVVPVHVAED
jgi:hypothetical protein